MHLWTMKQDCNGAFCQASFILFQGHLGGVPCPLSAHHKLRPSLLPGLVLERRSRGKSPGRRGKGGAHARAGLGGGGEEELPEVGGGGGGRAGGSCQGNRGAGRTARRQAGQAASLRAQECPVCLG
ncbi:translation initiation factor IF-2-like [Leopardus geoffroyi]|uniref:translation initiation factor IF-2-like n=1 Tax=Leopardus geoffroyi TaxID=46844 RepID=UPI001E264A55|nr:translation initiation factor IF-2-like [Leopardus geoffroyi]